jgi:hypothetical protein
MTHFFNPHNARNSNNRSNPDREPFCGSKSNRICRAGDRILPRALFSRTMRELGAPVGFVTAGLALFPQNALAKSGRNAPM